MRRLLVLLGGMALLHGAAALKTGPAIGSRIPEFEALDQMGARQTFTSLRGAKGLVLMFVRSADW